MKLEQSPQTVIFRVFGAVAIVMSLIGLGHTVDLYSLSAGVTNALKTATVIVGCTAAVVGLSELRELEARE
jgi:hypothetical protein